MQVNPTDGEAYLDQHIASSKEAAAGGTALQGGGGVVLYEIKNGVRRVQCSEALLGSSGFCALAMQRFPSYDRFVSSDTAQGNQQRLWKPHPDDEADLREAIVGAERGALLSPAASEAFLRWLEGGDDESWRDTVSTDPPVPTDGQE